MTAILISLLLISGCGFKPRGSGYESVSGQKIFLSSENPYNQFERKLREKLKAYSMELIDSPVEQLTSEPSAQEPSSQEQATVSQSSIKQSSIKQSGIKILSVQSSKKTLSVDSDGRATEFETKITVTLNFYFQNKQRVENKQFYAEQDYRYDKNSSLAHDKELETLESEMYEELGHRIATHFLRKLADD